MGLLDALADGQFRRDVKRNGLDLLQSASNNAASTVSAPVDALAWLLRKGGLNVPTPVGGSDWAQNQGYTKPVQEGWPKVAGDVLGNTAGLLGYAKAPEIAGGLLKMGENLAAPATMNKEAGVFRMPQYDAAKEARERAQAIAAESARNAEKEYAQKAAERYSTEGMGPHFDAGQLDAIKNYRLSGDRKGASAEGAAQTVNTLKNELERLGYPIETSQRGGGNSIYATVNGDRVRISDHSLPMTPERMTNRDRGLTGNWNREVLTDDWQGRGLKDFLAEILGKP